MEEIDHKKGAKILRQRSTSVLQKYGCQYVGLCKIGTTNRRGCAITRPKVYTGASANGADQHLPGCLIKSDLIIVLLEEAQCLCRGAQSWLELGRGLCKLLLVYTTESSFLV